MRFILLPHSTASPATRSALILVLLSVSAAAADPAAIELVMGKDSWPAGPVCFKPAEPLDRTRTYLVETPKNGAASAAGVPTQFDEQGRLWWWSPAQEAAKEPGTIVLQPAGEGQGKPDSQVVVGQIKDSMVNVNIRGQLFTVFNFGNQEPKPFLWPVIGPTGTPVTRSYPMKEVEGERKDHPHHRSIWSAWGDVRTKDFDKPGSNYWNQTKELKDQDRQIVKRIIRTASGPVFGQIEAEIDWVNHDGRREFAEDRTYTFFRGDENIRVIDVKNAFTFPQADVMFADTKEAGILSVRVATSMDEITLDKKPGKGQMTNSNGHLGSKGCWGYPAQWCDYFGPVDGQTIGIALFDAKGNLGHPPRWHIRDYGLFAVNNLGVKDFPDGKGKDGSHIFKRGESVAFDYRIIIHKGDAKSARIADQYRLYVESPLTKAR